MKNLSIILLSFFLSFCAFNKSQNDITNRENKKSEEKNKVLRDNYDMVTGFYQGKLHLPNEDRNITLGVYTLEVKEGNNSSGEPLFKPVLKAVYRQLYPIEAPIVLDGRFIPETGELSFTNPSTNISNEVIHTINATISGPKIAGVAKTLTGTLGSIDLDFVQKHVEAPTEGDDQNMTQKLREQYETISGTYIGKIKRAGNAGNEIQNEWDIEVGLYTLEVKSGTNANGENIFKPVLKAIFKQSYPIIPNILLDVQYVPETGQILFFNPQAGPDDLNTINAKLDGHLIDGSAKKSSGLWGSLHLELFSKNINTPPSGDENELNRKIREQYQKISGTYKGKVTKDASPGNPQQEWPVELAIYVLEVKSGTTPTGEAKFKPTLKALFKQISPVVPNVILDVQYITETGQLLFLNSQAGAEDLNTINAKLNDKTIEGTAQKTSGLWGNIKLEFFSKVVDTPNSGDENELNRRIREQYQEISGTYKGKVIKEATPGNPQQEWQVELALYVLEVRSGTTPTGEAKFKPTLKALFKQISPVVPNTILEAQYIAETGQLLFSNPQAGPEDLNTINAKLADKKIEGSAQRTSGFWGNIKLEFFSKAVDTPNTGDENELNRRIREQYQEISGTYKGKVIKEATANNPKQEWQVELALYVLEVRSGTTPTGEAKFKPTLKALFKQISPVVPNTILEAQYIAETGQLLFSNPQAGAEDLNTINAKLVDKSIEGTAQRTSGFWGNIKLEFFSKSVDTPNSGDENELNRRIREQYEEIAGTYQGKIIREATGTQPRQEWIVELGIYIIEVKSGTTPTGEPKFKPTLKAIFKQISPVIPNSLLDVQYIAETGQLLFSNAASGANNLNSINAFLKDKVIKGTATKTTGNWGNIELKFTSKNVDTPSSGTDEDYNRRLTEEYKTIIGSYTGRISPTGSGSEAFDVEVKIFIVQEAGPNGLIPKLKAYYKRTTDRYGATDLTMNVDYKTELNPPGVDMSGERSATGRAYFVILNGVYKNREITGQYHDQRGQSGPFRLKYKGP
jgi:ribosomal protein L19